MNLVSYLGDEHMKKFLSLILAFAMIGSMTATAFASEPVMADEDKEYVINADGTQSSVTIDEIDRLMEAKNRALFHKDYEAAEEIAAQLYELGGRPSTLEEIASINGGDMAAARASSGEYSTYYTTSTVNGKSYEIRRIYFSPTEDSNLFHSGVVAQKNYKPNIQARLCDVINVGISTGLGYVPGVGDGLSIMDCFGSLGDALTGTTVIEDIEASYSYSIMEYPVFLAYKNGEYWNNFAACSYVNADIISILYGAEWDGNKYKPDLKSKEYETSVYPDEYYYNNAPHLLEYYFTHSYFFVRVAQVQQFHIMNGGDNIVKSLNMVAPDSEADIH